MKKLFFLSYGPVGTVTQDGGVVTIGIWVVATSEKEAFRKGNERLQEEGSLLPLFKKEERFVGHYFFNK